LTASTWVENDKNLANGEASARHILYTKQYLSKLFDVSEDSLELDFEPDTFGHCSMLPEILQQGGVKYYYHCRGYKGHHIYNWKAPSGASVLVYREPDWYNQDIDEKMLLRVPGFCAIYGIKSAMTVYGVGDHGGGPTRRDVERIIKMQSWPLAPVIRFGTMHGFFKKLEAHKDRFPTVDHALNYIFTGCYTTQTRIKRANRFGEQRLQEAEILSSMAQVACPDYKPANDLTDPWRSVLFNQFHDILPGSGVTETREHALGIFQDAMASAAVNANHSTYSISKAIDTSFLAPELEGKFDDTSSRAYGAGVGYGLKNEQHWHFPSVERGTGDVRVYTFFNPTQYDRCEIADLTLWDMPGCKDANFASLLEIYDTEGNRLPASVSAPVQGFWGHISNRVAVKVSVPAFGYSSIIVRLGKGEHVSNMLPLDWQGPRLHFVDNAPIVLENDLVRAEFCPASMRLVSFVDKKTGKDMNDPSKPACDLRLITEAFPGRTNSDGTMSAWRVGRHSKIKSLSVEAPFKMLDSMNTAVRQRTTFKVPFDNSIAEIHISLDKDSTVLNFECFVDWREFGTLETGVPQLNFHVPMANPGKQCLCAVPYGIEKRPALPHDVPCIGLIAAGEGKRGLALMADSKYGFTFDGDSLACTLIRSSYNPDPMPEIGRHTFRLGLAITDLDNDSLLALNDRFASPLSAISTPIQEGTMAACGQLFSAEGAKVSSIKAAEDGNGFIVRLYNANEKTAKVKLSCAKEIASAEFVTLTERPADGKVSVGAKDVSFTLDAYRVASVRITLK
ncbi:MAG: hypothetical protein IIV87_01330, partial [Oscillospiraceae bacterium]|nr:hypothetical protein [Oscillospiraceae bacterium]